MAQENAPRTVTPPAFFSGDEGEELAEHSRKTADAVSAAMAGGMNNHFRVTLEVDETETNIIYSGAHSQSTCMLTPQSETAAAAVASGEIFVVSEKGKVVVHHGASSAADRVFGAVIFS